MIRIAIGLQEREGFDNIDEAWINKTINKHIRNGEKCCVKIRIDEPGVDLYLATSECSRKGGGGRKPNSDEGMIIGLWKKFELNDSCKPGKVVAFIKHLKKIL